MVANFLAVLISLSGLVRVVQSSFGEIEIEHIEGADSHRQLDESAFLERRAFGDSDLTVLKAHSRRPADAIAEPIRPMKQRKSVE